MRGRRLAVLLTGLVAGVLLLTGCGASGTPSAGSAATGAAVADGPHNDTDVMFLQMSLEHIRQGADVVRMAKERGGTPELRELATTMDAEWAADADTMARWLTAWNESLAADPDAGVHKGHGDVHSLLPEHVAELRAATADTFDRTALSLLVGHLHNVVEVSRLETTTGQHPQVKAMAATITTTREAQIQKILLMLA
jgi:uncharacterized protein (DUF305 family)